MLASITSNIRVALKCEKTLYLFECKETACAFSRCTKEICGFLLTLNLGYVNHIMFQAKVDKHYLSHGLNVHNYAETHSHVEDSINNVVCTAKIMYTALRGRLKNVLQTRI